MRHFIGFKSLSSVHDWLPKAFTYRQKKDLYVKNQTLSITWQNKNKEQIITNNSFKKWSNLIADPKITQLSTAQKKSLKWLTQQFSSSTIKLRDYLQAFHLNSEFLSTKWMKQCRLIINNSNQMSHAAACRSASIYQSLFPVPVAKQESNKKDLLVEKQRNPTDRLSLASAECPKFRVEKQSSSTI